MVLKRETTTPSINLCSLKIVLRSHDINFYPIISGVESDRKTHENIIENKKEKWAIHKINHLKSY